MPIIRVKCGSKRSCGVRARARQRRFERVIQRNQRSYKVGGVGGKNFAIGSEQFGDYQNKRDGHLGGKCDGAAVHTWHRNRIMYRMIGQCVWQYNSGESDATDGTQELRGDIEPCVPELHFSQTKKSDGDCRIEMTSRPFAPR